MLRIANICEVLHSNSCPKTSVHFRSFIGCRPSVSAQGCPLARHKLSYGCVPATVAAGGASGVACAAGDDVARLAVAVHWRHARPCALHGLPFPVDVDLPFAPPPRDARRLAVRRARPARSHGSVPVKDNTPPHAARRDCRSSASSLSAFRNKARTSSSHSSGWRGRRPASRLPTRLWRLHPSRQQVDCPGAVAVDQFFPQTSGALLASK
jgi:hypothetical protein